MTQLVHIGDFHSGPGPRNAVRFRALDQIIREGLALPGLGAWLWPGDLSHARQAIDDKNAIAERLQLMAGRAPVVICQGNHDLAGDLDVFARLETTHPIFVIDRPQTIRLKLATGEMASIFVLPYPTKGGLVAMGVSPGAVVDEGAAALTSIFLDAAEQLQTAAVQGDVTLAIGHVNVAGSATSVGQPNIGHEIELNPTHIAKLGPIYVGLNHIHKAQSIGGAHYPGSVCRLDWGEIEEKSYIVVTLGDAQHDYGFYNFLVERKPLDVPPMYHVEGQLTREGFVWQCTAGPGGEAVAKPATWKGCEVRVRYRFKQSEKSVLADARVLAEFADALKLEAEPIAEPDRALRAPEVAAARTLEDKLQAWCRSMGSDELTAGTLAKLACLEHGDHLQLLTDLQNRLADIEAGERASVAA
jgi:DNA repair exonuclease SbcCD nuclease subunit